MDGFGYKTGWLAVRDGDADAVLAQLGGEAIGPIGWREGIHRSYDTPDTVVVTPLLPGAGGGSWLLVAGWWLAAGHESIDTAALSRALGREVQLFVTHRVVELHRWERAVDGSVIRSFEYIGERGEVTRWVGALDEVERAIGLPETFRVGDGAAEDADVIVNERDVMRVAGAWSVDPTSLEGQPAPGPLTVARIAGAPPRKVIPRMSVVDVTDLMTADISHERRTKLVAQRIRRRRWRNAFDRAARLFKRPRR
jgi:hypothetical protein